LKFSKLIPDVLQCSLKNVAQEKAIEAIEAQDDKRALAPTQIVYG
jgi:hypothetical protein